MKITQIVLACLLSFPMLATYARCDTKKLHKEIDRLIDSYPELDDDVGFLVTSCNVVLKGRVDSPYEKELAEKLVQNIEGIENLYSGIVVEKDSIFSSEFEMTSVEARP